MALQLVTVERLLDSPSAPLPWGGDGSWYTPSPLPHISSALPIVVTHNGMWMLGETSGGPVRKPIVLTVRRRHVLGHALFVWPFSYDVRFTDDEYTTKQRWRYWAAASAASDKR